MGLGNDKEFTLCDGATLSGWGEVGGERGGLVSGNAVGVELVEVVGGSKDTKKKRKKERKGICAQGDDEEPFAYRKEREEKSYGWIKMAMEALGMLLKDSAAQAGSRRTGAGNDGQA